MMTKVTTVILVGSLAAVTACGPATVSDLDEGGTYSSGAHISMPVPEYQAPSAAPVIYDAVAVRVTEKANDFIESQVANRDIHYQNPRIEKPNMKCFDMVGINNFELDSHIDLADLDWQASPDGLSLVAYVDYIDVGGQITGDDSDTFDLCPSFSATINSMRLSGVVFTAKVRPYTDGSYNMYVSFDPPPTIQVAEFDVDVNGFLGVVADLVLSFEFAEDFLFKKVNEALAEKVPELTRDALFYAMFTGTAGPALDYAIGVGDIGIDAGGATAKFDVQIDYTGERAACLPIAATPDFSVRGEAALGTYGDTSMAELGVSDAVLNQVIWAAWKSGFMCFDSESKPLESFQHVLEGISPAAGEMMKYKLVVAEPPQVLFHDGKLEAKINKFFMEATVTGADGTEKLLMRMKANMRMGMKMDLDRATNQMLVSLDGTELTFDAIESEILFAEDRDTEAHLKSFVKGYVIPRLNSKIQSMPVTNVLFPIADYIILVDNMVLREGHAVAGISIFGKNDPGVDKIAPDTEIPDAPGLVTKTYTTIGFQGSDDMNGTLVYSWQIDGTGWSSFSEEQQADLSGLIEGNHVFEVKARDRWMNEDGSPASVAFQVAAQKGDAPTAGACDMTPGNGSSTPAGAVASLFAAVAVGLVAVRRRGMPISS